jgi:hypothetical protein
MMSNDDILSMCEATQPAYIYLAIGCALGHYAEGGGTPQQYPPPIAALPGRKICILVDPGLESPPRSYAQVGIPDPTAATQHQHVTHGDVTFIPVRREFHWPVPWAHAEHQPAIQHDARFIDGLIALTKRPGSPTRLIVQDYAGTDIRPFYPHTAPPARVLYDMTGRDGGCFVDFAAVRIHQTPTGDFIQPPYELLRTLQSILPADELRAVVEQRSRLLTDYAHRYYRIMRGVEPPRDWASPQAIGLRLAPLFVAYSLPPNVRDPANLFALLSDALCDFAVVAGDYLDDDAIARNLDADSPTGAPLRELLSMLCMVATSHMTETENQPPPTENGVQ